MKIAVYTIALDELAHCERWANSVADADYRIVLDTGSTDGTVSKLRSLGVTVYEQKITPWRFDKARNIALSMVPVDADVCISMDMDEFMEVGYRAKIENIWTQNTTRIAYTYIFDYKLGAGFYCDKIHARYGYEWRRPVHENIFSISGREVISSDLNIKMNQLQDRNKQTRNNYINLLELAHNENQSDSQIAFWYGRELMYKGINDKSIIILKKYLELSTATWDAERSEALLYLSKLESNNTWGHLLNASYTAPHRREVWVEIANYCYSMQDWINLLWACLNGLSKSQKQNSYLDKEESWGSQLNDLGSIAAYHLGWFDKALEFVLSAIDIEPNNERLKSNLQFIKNAGS